MSQPDASPVDQTDESVQPTKPGDGSECGEAQANRTAKTGFWSRLGPGLITGASDDDPSGIATYSQSGAQLGFSLLWTLLFSFPLMAATQEISARIGRVTGRGIAGNLRRHYPRWLLYSVVSLLCVANVINLAADLGAMGDALTLLIGGPASLYVVLFSVATVLLQIFVPYRRYTNILKWLTLVVFSYVATAFAVRIPWGEALRQTILPNISFTSDYLATFIAVLGTTISPYLFFWQASLETEEIRCIDEDDTLLHAPQQARAQFSRIRLDTYVGMALSNIVAFFIMLTAAVTLHMHGVTDIETSAQAAKALEPVAGKLAFALFSLGIIGTGLLAVPVLAGSTAYAVSEALKWPIGLDRKPLQAKGFYAVIAVSMLLGLIINFTPINPIKALFWSAVINGVVAAPVMAVMMLMVANPRVVGKFTLVSKPLRAIGWLATAVMLAAAVGLFATWK